MHSNSIGATLSSTPRWPADAHPAPRESAPGGGLPYRDSSRTYDPEAAIVRCLRIGCHICRRYGLECEELIDGRAR
jgi:hypothetical protein